MEKTEIQQKITDIETAMSQPDFWADKARAQETIREYEDLKLALEGVGKYDRGGAIVNIFAGAGGDDSEDFVRMLYHMYQVFCRDQGWETIQLAANTNSVGGYRNLSFEVDAKNVYGKLRHESGVHRLVRISPFNAQGKRQTSFAMVEVLPKIEPKDFSHIDIPKDDLEISFARSSGPGGQNVNKRDTAVRMQHIPTGISVHVESQRTQEANRDKALQMIKGRLAHLLEQQEKESIADLHISKTSSNEWGSQMRSYVLHPYQMVKDHRTDYETRDTKKVLEDGDIMPFIKAMQENGGGE